MTNYTEAQLRLDFIRCWRCSALDRSDWFAERLGCRYCGSRRIVEPTGIKPDEAERIASGWFEDEGNK